MPSLEKILPAPMGVRWCYDVQLGRYWGTNDTRKRVKLALTIYRGFMQSVFNQILRGGAIQTASNRSPNVC